MYEIYARMRDERGMTDYQVAKQTNIAGQTLYAWKDGKYTPKIDKLRKIAKLFGVPVGELLGTEEE